MTGYTRKTVLVCILALLAGPIQQGLADSNTVEIDEFMHVLAEQQMQMPDGTTEIIILKGRATQHVIFEGLKEGLADDDDGNHLDEVDTEMVELSLSGMSSFGPVQMRLWTAYPSVGQMEEIRNDKEGLLEVPPFGEGFVESFFDIFFELNLAGQNLYGEGPMRCTGTLSHKPPAPGDVYENQTQIRLLNDFGQWSGLRWGPGRISLNPVVEVDVFETAICMLDLQMSDGTLVTIPMVGDSTEHVFFEGAVEGSAFDDDGNLRDEVQTEMVELDLRGYHSDLGPVNMRLNTDLPSTGQMEEQADTNPGLLDVPPFCKDGRVDSFFDIYFEFDIPAFGLTLHNQDPMHLRGVLSHKPAGPMDIYENQQQIELYNENGNPTGHYIGAIRYRPNPVVEVDVLDTSMGLVDLVSPSGQSYTVELMGTSKVHVFFEGYFEGSANDDDGDGLDEVQTELVELSLSGFDPVLGDVHLRLDERMLTLGEIEESSDSKTGRLDIPPFASCGTAQSFFDVHFEIEVAGIPMYPERPPRLSSIINEKPVAPGDVYEYLEGVKLVDSDGAQTDYTLITVRFVPRTCGGPGHPYPLGDANRDCRVNLLDVAIVGLHWLECTRPECN